MGLNRNVSLTSVLLMVLVGMTAGSTTISDSVLRSNGSSRRSLLQATSSCPIDVQHLNYTIITSKCEAPYPPSLCCAAFKEFVCPYADEFFNETNSCASEMYSYIDTIGNYTSGLFSSECNDNTEGILCPASPPQPQNYDISSASLMRPSLTSSIPLVCGVILTLLSS